MWRTNGRGPSKGRLQMQSKADEVLTIEDLSAYLKVSKSTLYALARDGALPGTKVGKHWRFHKGVLSVGSSVTLSRGRHAAGHA